MFLPSQLSGQIRRIRGNLKNRWVNLDRNTPGSRFIDKSYQQDYSLEVDGFAVNPKLLIFSLRSSFNDFSRIQNNGSSESRTKRTDYGYFDASATLFPNNGFRLTGFGSMQTIDDTRSSNVVMSEGMLPYQIQKMDRYGIEMGIPGNTYYPTLDFYFQREHRRCIDPCTVLDQQEDFIRLSLSNSSTTGSSYRLFYHGRIRDDDARLLNQDRHEFNFQGEARPIENLSLRTMARYLVLNKGANSTLEVFGRYNHSSEHWYELRLTNAESRYAGSQNTKSMNNNAQLQMISRQGKERFLRLGAEYTENVSTNITRDYGNYRIEGFAELQLTKNYNSIVLTGVGSTRLGTDQRLTTGTQFIQLSSIGGSAVIQASRGVMLIFRNDAFFETMYSLGNQFRNAARLELTLTPSNFLRFHSRVMQNDIRFLDVVNYASSSQTVLEGTLDLNLLSLLSISLYHNEMYSSSYEYNMRRISRVSATIPNILSHLEIKIMGDQAYGSSGVIYNRRYEVQATMQFYAFALRGRFLRTIIGSYRDDQMFLEISRPLEYLFRR
jgi:hypothetical protein